MHVLGTLLFGSAHVCAFDLVNGGNLGDGSNVVDSRAFRTATTTQQRLALSEPLLARLCLDRTVRAHEVLEISPARCNVHSISAASEACGLLDIIAPPYLPGERECTFYEAQRVVRQSEAKSNTPNYANDDSHYVLFPVSPDYDCYSQKYTGILPRSME
jgi:hypothetical protein